MTAFSKPTLTKAYEVVQLLPAVPAGQGAEVSFSLLNKPKNVTVFKQKTAVAAGFTLGAAVPYTITTMGNVYHGATDVKISPTGTAYKVASASATQGAAISTTTTPIGIQYKFAPLVPNGAYTTLLNTGFLVTKSLPTIDYAADPALTGIVGVYDTGAVGPRFIRRSTLVDAYTVQTGTAAGSGYSSAGATSYYSNGMVGYGPTAIAVNAPGYMAFFRNSITLGATNVSADNNFTSETGTYGPYSMTGDGTQSITLGSPQVMFVAGAPQFWMSSDAAGSQPKMCMILVATLAAGSYSSWIAFNSVSFNFMANGTKLYWLRYCDQTANYYVGASDGKIYRSTVGFNSAYAAVANAIPADVDVSFPPIRISVNQLAFRSIAGDKFWIMNQAATDTWSSFTADYGYVAEPLLATTITSNAIGAVIYSESIGPRPVDKRLWTATNKYDVAVPFDSRDAAADVLQKASAELERTGFVLEAGDILQAYAESAGAIIHAYGFQE
jgi:hypothetical protein